MSPADPARTWIAVDARQFAIPGDADAVVDHRVVATRDVATNDESVDPPQADAQAMPLVAVEKLRRIVALV